MNAKEIVINNKKVLIFDAPLHVVHGRVVFNEGARYNVSRKSRIKDTFVFDNSNIDSILEKKYDGQVINVGMVNSANEAVVANLFTPVKRGNFYDYEHHGIFYPRAVDALKDIVEQETGYTNPFVIIVTNEI